MNRRILLIAVAGVVLAAWLVMTRPLESTMPVYVDLAQQLSDAPLETSFEPLGYSYLIAAMPGDSVATQARVLHFVSYFALACMTVWFLGTAAKTYPVVSALASLAILFNPYVLINLFRINDNNVNVPAIAAIFVLLRWSVAVIAANKRLAVLIGASALIGAVITVRPNAVTLLGAVVMAMRERLAEMRGRAIVTVVACVITAAVVYSAGSWLMTGRSLFWPTNGPYNLFAGNNPAAMSALVADYNAEMSLPAGLVWCGTETAPRAVAASTFTSCTARFWREQPFEALQLAGMKFYTMLFRPNLRLADSNLETALQLLTMILPLAWWSSSAFVLVRRRELLDPLALVFIVLYAAPFIVTNADPRFRLPLDAVYAFSLASPSVLARLGGEGRVVST